MDQVKIGKFIAELRKQQGLTQAQLGGRLGVTNKTVSRWENGNYMPDLALIPDLAMQLDTSVNELMAGERFVEEEYKRGADEQLLKNMRLIEEIREIKDSRWLSQGMGEAGCFIFVGSFVGVLLSDFSPFSGDADRFISNCAVIGMLIFICGALLIASISGLERRLHISTALGAGLMVINFGYCYAFHSVASMLVVGAVISVVIGMLGNRMYFQAIDKLLEANMKIKDKYEN